MSNEDKSKAEVLFEAYMEQTQFLQVMYLSSWEKLREITILEQSTNGVELFNKAIERQMEFLATLIILNEEE